MIEPTPEELDQAHRQLEKLAKIPCHACGLRLYDPTYADVVGWAVPGLGFFDGHRYHVRCVGLARATRRFNRAFAAAMRTRTIVPGPPPTDTDV